jgi:tetratricopeptide (TPR) repeat protein
MPASRVLLLIPLCLCTAAVSLPAQDTDLPAWRVTKATLYRAFTSAREHLPAASAALELAHQASITSLEGRPAEAEVLAERSFAILKDAAPNGPLLLEPLQTLAAAQLDQKKIGKARETTRRMREIPTSRPEDRARVEGTIGALQQMEGRHDESEIHYRNAWAAWQQAGKVNTAEASTVLSCLGTLYTHAGRYSEAEQMLDRALALLNASRNATRLDRIKLWNNRAVLYGRLARWRPAEAEMRNAVKAAEGDPPLDPVYLATLLTNFAQILRATRHTAEARAVETRAGDVRQRLPQKTVVDVTELPVRVQKYLW